MPLPTLPADWQDSAYHSMVRSLPGRWFHQLESKESPLYPYLWGLAYAMAHARSAIQAAQDAAIPMRSGGPWLSLHLQSIGLQRLQSESDAAARRRYQLEFALTRNTRAGHMAALTEFFGLEPPQIRLETDFAEGRYGEFRLILDDTDLPWTEFDLDFVGPFVRRYVANGITPSVTARLHCLLYQALPAYQFSDQFPMGHNQLGPFWERPAFVCPERLPFARNLITQVTEREWRDRRDTLKQFFEDARVDAPGAMFIYLADSCPFLDAELEISTDDPTAIAVTEFDPDGLQFCDDLPYIGFSEPFRPIAEDLPIVEVNGLVADDLPVIEEQGYGELVGTGEESVGQNVLGYAGLDFTRLIGTVIYGDSFPAPLAAAEINRLSDGPWRLALTEGLPEWGILAPPGNEIAGTPFAMLHPDSLWWTDASGEMRSAYPFTDSDTGDVFLVVEFLLPAAAAPDIREFALYLDGVEVRYQRLNLPIDANTNTGFMFKIRGILTDG